MTVAMTIGGEAMLGNIKCTPDKVQFSYLVIDTTAAAAHPTISIIICIVSHLRANTVRLSCHVSSILVEEHRNTPLETKDFNRRRTRIFLGTDMSGAIEVLLVGGRSIRVRGSIAFYDYGTVIG